MTEPISVTALNRYVKQLLDRDVLLSQVLVRSEISNYKMYPSGHHYFTLKDPEGALRASGICGRDENACRKWGEDLWRMLWDDSGAYKSNGSGAS